MPWWSRLKKLGPIASTDKKPDTRGIATPPSIVLEPSSLLTMVAPGHHDQTGGVGLPKDRVITSSGVQTPPNGHGAQGMPWSEAKMAQVRSKEG